MINIYNSENATKITHASEANDFSISIETSNEYFFASNTDLELSISCSKDKKVNPTRGWNK